MKVSMYDLRKWVDEIENIFSMNPFAYDDLKKYNLNRQTYINKAHWRGYIQRKGYVSRKGQNVSIWMICKKAHKLKIKRK